MIEKEIQMAVNYLKATSESNYRISLQTGISQPSIAKYRRGERIPGLATARAIVAYFTKPEEHSATTGREAEMDEVARLLQSLECRDEQIRELIRQQERLVAVIERMQRPGAAEAPATGRRAKKN